MMKAFSDMIKASGEVVRGERDDLEESIYKYITSDYDKEWGSERKPGFHPSGMFYRCPRQDLLARKIPKTLGPQWGRDMLLTFNHGHSIHFWFQNRILGPMGLLLGSWECLKCGSITKGSMPKKCECGADRRFLDFMERDVSRGPFVGHIDGEILLPSGPAILEIKSTSMPDTALSSPLDYNVYQANIYMWVTGVHQSLILYVSKSKSFKLRAFTVCFDMAMLEDAMRRARDCILVEEMSDAEVSSADPKGIMGICPSLAAKPAMSCAWINECFGGQF